MGDAAERAEHRGEAKRSFQKAARESGARRASGNGLVVASYLSVRRDGRLVQLSLPGVPSEPPKRGDCEGFSESARRRLMVKLHSIRRDAKLPVMVTLTFPSELTVTAREAKACRLAFEKRMTRSYGPRWCGIWRMEAHPELSFALSRFHPHFHLLTWGAFYALEEVSRAWTETIWSVLKVDECLSDETGRLVKEKSISSGTNCERVRTWQGVVYCGKNYIAKEETFPIGKAGRVWGYSNAKALPIAEEERIPLTYAQASMVRVAIEAWMTEKKIVSEHLICTFFDDAPSEFVARLMARCGVAMPAGKLPVKPSKL